MQNFVPIEERVLWNDLKTIHWVSANLIKLFFHTFLKLQVEKSKAGRLVGLAECYAVMVLADNAKFLLAVNRIAAFRSHSAITYITNEDICSRGSVGRA